jgi:hypothetical protein
LQRAHAGRTQPVAADGPLRGPPLNRSVRQSRRNQGLPMARSKSELLLTFVIFSVMISMWFGWLWRVEESPRARPPHLGVDALFLPQ